MNKMKWILPLEKSVVPNESPFGIVRPDTHIQPPLSSVLSNESPCRVVELNTQELQYIKNMIFSLQIDLQEESCKRECLEEKLRKFEGNQNRMSHGTPECKERKLQQTEMRCIDEETPQDECSLPARNTTQDIDEKIEEFRSDFDLRLRNLDQSISEIRSILANNPVGPLKSDKKSFLEPGQSKDKDYNRFLYKKLERGVFPQEISLKNAILKSVDDLLHKPCSEKSEVEAIMDQYYLDNLPPALLRPDDIENKDRTI
jgi:hypothetical protein